MTTVLLLSHTDQVSGAEAVLINVADELTRRGVDVTVACPNGKLADSLPPTCRHVPIPQLTLGGRRGLRRIGAIFGLVAQSVVAARAVRAATLGRSGGPDVTISNSMLALPLAQMSCGKNGYSWLVHDTVTNAAQKIIINFSRLRMNHAVAVSQATAAPLRAMNLDTRVAFNGIRWPVECARPPAEAIPVVGILALLTPWKGHRQLLEAVARTPGVQLEIAGGSFPTDADYVKELHARVAEPDLAGRVQFLGHRPAPEVLARWHVAVSASTSPEAGPLAVLEAMAHGVAMVGTDHGGTAEYLSDTGLLVPPGDVPALADAIRLLTKDADLRDELSRRARDRVAQHFDSTVTLPALVSALGVTTD